MQKVAVVYFPKTNLDKINFFREKYDQNLYIIPPHITIVSPVSEVPENKLIEHVEKVTKNIEPFSIRLTGITKTYDDCLFLMVKEGNEKIVILHDKLYSGMLSFYTPTDFSFTPHLTLGDFVKVDDKSLAKAYFEAQGLNFDITFELDSLSIIKGDGLNPAEIVRTINLQSKNV